MTSWTLEKGLRVDVQRMGTGTVTKVTNNGAMVLLDTYKIEVEIQKDWMRPLDTSSGQELTHPSPLIATPPTASNTGGTMGSGESGKPYSAAAQLIMGAMGLTNQAQQLGVQSAAGNPITQPVEPKSSQASEPQRRIEPIDAVVDPKLLRARRAMESLRFGLVPHGFIEELTLGYDELKNWSRYVLPGYRSGKPGMFKIVGPFGTGKSHTIAVMRHIAEQEGYLTAKVEVDGQTYSLSEPSRLLHTLWSSLHGQGFESESPLVQLYKKVYAAGYTTDHLRQLHLPRAADNLSSIERMIHAGAIDAYEEEIEAVISGSDEITPTEAARRITQDYLSLKKLIALQPPISKSLYMRYGNFVEAVASTAKLSEMSGYKGLVLFVDEFEVESVSLSGLRLDRVVYQLRILGSHFIQYQNPELPTLPLSLVFGTVGSQYDLAETEIDRWLPGCNGSSFNLHLWNQEERLVLANKIFELYKMAYGVEEAFHEGMASALDNKLAEDGDDDSGFIRRFIKWYVSLLDMRYGPPGESKS